MLAVLRIWLQAPSCLPCELSLALFKAGILFVDDIQFAFPSHNFAINTAFFNGCTNFHDLVFTMPVYRVH